MIYLYTYIALCCFSFILLYKEIQHTYGNLTNCWDVFKLQYYRLGNQLPNVDDNLMFKAFCVLVWLVAPVIVIGRSFR